MSRLRAFSALLALLSAGAFGWFALDRPVRVVQVEGQLAASEAAEIRRRIGRALDGRFLSLDVARLRARVMELSWPGEVSVRKVWPDTVVVRVARRTVVARWADAGYLTPTGEIVSTPNGPLDVPIFDCALSSPREAMEIYRYLQGMASGVGLAIERVSENEIGEWKLVFAEQDAWPRGNADASGALLIVGGPTLMLGADSLRERMQRFLVAWSRFLASRAASVDYVDLRYGSGIAVRWRESETQHAEALIMAGTAGTT